MPKRNRDYISFSELDAQGRCIVEFRGIKWYWQVPECLVKPVFEKIDEFDVSVIYLTTDYIPTIDVVSLRNDKFVFQQTLELVMLN